MAVFVLSSFPILLIFLLMAFFHFGAAKASLIGYVFCLFISVLFFGANRWVLYFSHIKGFWYTLDVLLIIWAAFIFYLIVEKSGAIRLLGEVLPSLTPSKDLQALLVGWVFASFLQGVGGFGVPVAVVAPILVGLNFSLLQAVLIPSIGHGWAVTFGSLGSSFRALIATTAQPIQPLGVATALLLGSAGLGCGFSVLYLTGGWKSIRQSWFQALSLGLLMGGILILMVWKGLWNLASFLSATAGLVWTLVIIAFKNHAQFSFREVLGKLGRSFSGYWILVAVIILVQFMPPLQRYLQNFTLYSDLPAFHTNSGIIHLDVREIAAERVGNLHLFIHPGVVLLYACLITYLFYWLKKEIPSRSYRMILQDAARRLIPTTLCVWSMVTVAVIMENCGMTSVIASTMSHLAFNHYSLIAPWIGAIGAFITGSNTNSNILFGLLQSHTAQFLHIPIYLILAGQTAGASLGSVLAPAKIIVGTSTTGLVGKEGLVLKKLLPFVILEVLLISMILYYFV